MHGPMTALSRASLLAGMCLAVALLLRAVGDEADAPSREASRAAFAGAPWREFKPSERLDQAGTVYQYRSFLSTS